MTRRRAAAAAVLAFAALAFVFLVANARQGFPTHL
jgi:hypothetical protein